MPDDYSRHEVLHMASFLADAVERELLDANAIREDPEWEALAKQAHDALVQLYQRIGVLHILEDGAQEQTQ